MQVAPHVYAVASATALPDTGIPPPSRKCGSMLAMADCVVELSGARILECGLDGERIASERDALDLIGRALESGADAVAIPVERLAAEFFRLRSTLAGVVVQKFMQYRRRLVIVGDVSQYAAEGSAFAAFVAEANRGWEVWFVGNLADLRTRMRGSAIA